MGIIQRLVLDRPPFLDPTGIINPKSSNLRVNSFTVRFVYPVFLPIRSAYG